MIVFLQNVNKFIYTAFPFSAKRALDIRLSCGFFYFFSISLLGGSFTFLLPQGM